MCLMAITCNMKGQGDRVHAKSNGEMSSVFCAKVEAEYGERANDELMGHEAGECQTRSPAPVSRMRIHA